MIELFQANFQTISGFLNAIVLRYGARLVKERKEAEE